MPKTEGDYGVSDTGNWNVASDFSKLKIMKNLYLADEYEIVATFGTIDLYEELQANFNTDFLKIKAFKRLVKTLMMLIDNSKFAISIKNDRTLLDKYKKTLIKINGIIPLLSNNKQNRINNTSEITLDHKIYDKVLEEVINIKALINEPLIR
ncbi:hypothetical protein LCGC14_2824620 [marine sediment metagenome]|uniref:Uncharacterized protein n=1 Tax=marine sediment metagenome TaxID=412755 RepID=A0A0F9APC9_9ZZZZ